MGILDNFEWVANNVVGTAGGLLSIWDLGQFSFRDVSQTYHILWCNGLSIPNQKRVNIVNVHGPLTERGKIDFWYQLQHHILIHNGEAICIYGRF